MKMKKISSARSKEKSENRVSVNFTPMEYAHFLTMKEESSVQFRSVGVNYNQTLVAMKSNFTEKKVFAMLTKLEKLTLELAIIGGEIVQLTRESQEKWQHR